MCGLAGVRAHNQEAESGSDSFDSNKAAGGVLRVSNLLILLKPYSGPEYKSLATIYL